MGVIALGLSSQERSPRCDFLSETYLNYKGSSVELYATGLVMALIRV